MGSIEYAWARLSARFGARPDEADWRRIEHVRGFPALIEATRGPAFNAWMTGIGPMSTVHDIELLLRGRWREITLEVWRWMPEAWQPALAWCERIADLPAIEHLARGGETLPWMRDDPLLREFRDREAAGAPTIPASGPFARFAPAWADPGRVGRCWRDEWNRRRPPRAGDEREPIDALAALVGRHLSAFRDPLLADGWPLRRTLQQELVLLFRRAVLDPAAAFAYLALAALDLERLRGELLRRAAFPGSG